MIWTTEGFAGFREGTFGNGGQNLYVSKKGVLQRIYQHDLLRNGYFPLVFANCQNHHESAESYLYDDAGHRTELPGQGCLAGVVTDLTGDGWQDIVIAGYYDMAAPHASTDIYFGSAEGYSEKAHIRIPTPWAEDCCAGHFRGEKRPSLAFVMPKYKIVRIFTQTELGLEWSGYQDYPIEAANIAAADLDGDGFDELIVRQKDKTETTVYWGGADGIALDRFTILPELPASEVEAFETEHTLKSEMEREFEPPRRLKKIQWSGRDCFTLFTGKKMLLYSSGPGRELECLLSLDAHMAMDAAVGDFNGDGLPDLAIAARGRKDDSTARYSYLWLNSPEGFLPENRIDLEINFASSVAAAGNRIVFGQCTDGTLYTNDALLYTFRGGVLDPVPERFEGEDMRRSEIFRNPDGRTWVFLMNHYSRRSVGFDKVYVYWGDAQGYAPEHRLELPGWCAVDSLSADFDDDGRAELLVCNNSENSLHLNPGHQLHHFGPAGFQPERSICLKNDIGWGAIAADFDHDGELEIVSIADTWRKLRMFKGKDFSQYEDISLGMEEMQYGGGRWIMAVDLNRNGWLDLVVPIITGNRTLILWGGPQGYSMERHTELAVVHGVCARAADLSRNGWPDLIIGGHTANIYGCDNLPHEPHHSFVHIYWNGPEGISESRKTVLRADAAAAMAIADFNNDGWLDIFAGSYHGGKDRDINSFIYWNREGSFRELDRELLFTHSASGCIAADFNRDGYVDLAVANHKVDGDHLGYSTVWWNGEAGFNPRQVTNLPTCGPHGMSVIEPGNQLTREDGEFYYSPVRRLERAAVVTDTAVTGEIPPETAAELHLRTAVSEQELAAAPWREPAGFTVPAGHCLQYRLTLRAELSLRSPRITKVTITLTDQQVQSAGIQ